MDLDSWSAALAIALRLRDLDELEAFGATDPAISQIQRTQLQIDAGFDTVGLPRAWLGPLIKTSPRWLK